MSCSRAQIVIVISIKPQFLSCTFWNQSGNVWASGLDFESVDFNHPHQFLSQPTVILFMPIRVPLPYHLCQPKITSATDNIWPSQKKIYLKTMQISPRTRMYPKKSTKAWPLAAVLKLNLRTGDQTDEERQKMSSIITLILRDSKDGQRETWRVKERVVSAADPDSWALRNAWLILTRRKKPKWPPTQSLGVRGQEIMQMLPPHCSKHLDLHKETSEDHMGLSVIQLNIDNINIIT